MHIDIDRLERLASGCYDAIKSRVEEISQLEADLADLDGNTCNGREYWRDRDHSTKTPKLYVIHSIDQACPLHGTPEAGQRLRVYVGSDPNNIAQAQAAITQEQTRHKLQYRLDNIEYGLSSSRWTLERFYGNLGYQVNDDGTVTSR